MGSTKVELVQDLQNELVKNRSKYNNTQLQKIHTMISQAESGHYHDFESSLATPKIILKRDLEGIPIRKLVRKVLRGDYDEPYEGGAS